MVDLTETLLTGVKDLAEVGSGDDSSGPVIEVDAPAWALREDAGRDRLLGGWGIALLGSACALMAALGGLLILALDNHGADATVRDTLAIAFAADIALLALIGRSLLSKSDPSTLLRVSVRRPVPAKGHDLAAQITEAATRAASAALGGSGAPPAAPDSSPPPAESPSSSSPAAAEAANPASALSAFISREPVLIQGFVLVAGSLALAFGTGLEGAEVGGIAAAAAAALTLLTRAATTSVAEPKGANSEPLQPSQSATAAPAATATVTT